ncbi:conjugal transfer protein TraR [Saccharibacillus sp. CPCC 101409]|uniref:conjugal transfer protein TraR n=1 Tax=Saccharibacillus sp. CPCC 101409 TaxID=3058041 RepID=UPI002671FDFB|nr:conjugal transfer protein TraR [Saccharibacillus sp. CPCC 101409]MDO3412272.1 conjugal transfer protein TraR [Saccharibacillus sp. CPCC 101409]
MKHLDDSQIDTLKNLLLEQKSELEQHFGDSEDTTTGFETSLRVSTGELSSVDNHPADLGTEEFERSRDMAIDSDLSDRLDEVNAALKRIEDGTYGVDITTGKEIPFERLEAVPYTAYNVDTTPENGPLLDYRPVEEEVMTPPPAGAGENRQEHAGKFDDSHAWQAVESYGNADSPAMSTKRDVKSYDQISSENDPDEGTVESYEKFTGNDMTEGNRSVEMTRAEREYIEAGEGERVAEIDESVDDEAELARAAERNGSQSGKRSSDE